MSKPLTDRARMALAIASEEATRLSSSAVEPEHLLLGILAVPTAFGRAILVWLDIDVDRLSEDVSTSISADSQSLTPSPSPAYDAAIAHAQAEASDCVGTEHLLIAVVFAADSDRIKALGLSPDAIRAKLREYLEWQGPPPPCENCGAASTTYHTEDQIGIK